MTATASITARQHLAKIPVYGQQPTILADVYQNDNNIVIWQRELSDKISQAAQQIINRQPTLQASATVTPENVENTVSDFFNNPSDAKPVADDVAHLVNMFCYLFELKRVGLRLTSLDRAMCPRFHVDRVPARLVTTYRGVATEWLAHDVVDRSKLGTGNQGKPDDESGLILKPDSIQQLSSGDVALLKGELWEGNEGAGLVHRSPQVEDNEQRLLLTLDFIFD